MHYSSKESQPVAESSTLNFFHANSFYITKIAVVVIDPGQNKSQILTFYFIYRNSHARKFIDLVKYTSKIKAKNSVNQSHDANLFPL